MIEVSTPTLMSDVEGMIRTAISAASSTKPVNASRAVSDTRYYFIVFKDPPLELRSRNATQ